MKGTYSVWAKVPHYVFEDGRMPIPRAQRTLTSGLAIRALDPDSPPSASRHWVSGEVWDVGHLQVLVGEVPMILMPSTAVPAARSADGEGLFGEVLVEPYLWAPGVVRDRYPSGWASWRIRQVVEDPSPGQAGPVALLELIGRAP